MTDKSDQDGGDWRDEPAPEADADADDDDLVAALRAVVGRVDPVPPEMIAAARASFLWRTIDAELAQLTSDSVLDADRMASVRGTSTPELLTFEGAGISVEVETTSGPDGLELLGQVVPAQPGQVEVRHAGGTATVEVDDLGRFRAEGLVPGPVSLQCRTAIGTIVATDWFLA